MAGGFHGIIWDVDLSNQRAAKADIAEEDFRLYLGGSGLGAKLLLQELDSEEDPLSMNSPLLFFPGMITGSPAPTACRTIVMGRSPLTGIWGEATAGGFWGAELKSSGVDGLIIRGRAEKPVYLWITPEGLEFKDASHIWGKDTYDTDDRIKSETDGRARVAAVGPAGENLSLIASVMFEGHNARAAGRCGFGALMGSKNLKAVAVRARGKVPVHDPDGLKALLKEHVPQIQQFAAGLTKFGTSGGVEAVEALGDLPIKNWRLGSWAEGATAIAGQTNLPKYLDKHYACFGCPIRCGKLINIPANGDGEAIRTHNPEYETLAGFGANLLNDDFSVVARAGDLCNRLGLDTMSASSTVAFAMECYEKGLITKEDTGGLEIAWGDANAILSLVRMIAYGEGIGAVLAKGRKRPPKRSAPRSQAFAVGVKGLEVAFHDPRAFTSMAVSYATSVRGACHLEGLTYFPRPGHSPGRHGLHGAPGSAYRRREGQDRIRSAELPVPVQRLGAMQIHLHRPYRTEDHLQLVRKDHRVIDGSGAIPSDRGTPIQSQADVQRPPRRQPQGRCPAAQAHGNGPSRRKGRRRSAESRKDAPRILSLEGLGRRRRTHVFPPGRFGVELDR